MLVRDTEILKVVLFFLVCKLGVFVSSGFLWGAVDSRGRFLVVLLREGILGLLYFPRAALQQTTRAAQSTSPIKKASRGGTEITLK